MSVATLVKRVGASHAFDEIDDENETPEQELLKIQYSGVSMRWSQILLALIDYQEGKPLDRDQKRLLRKGVQITRDIREVSLHGRREANVGEYGLLSYNALEYLLGAKSSPTNLRRLTTSIGSTLAKAANGSAVSKYSLERTYQTLVAIEQECGKRALTWP